MSHNVLLWHNGNLHQEVKVTYQNKKNYVWIFKNTKCRSKGTLFENMEYMCSNPEGDNS